MTTVPDPAPVIEPAPLVVAPKSRTRLAAFHDAYAEAKALADDASAKLKAITDAIKLELTQLDPEQRRFDLVPTGKSTAPTLRLSYSERWTLDSKKLKSEDPETYVRYAKQGGSWTLKAVAGGGDEQ